MVQWLCCTEINADNQPFTSPTSEMRKVKVSKDQTLCWLLAKSSAMVEHYRHALESR